MPNKIFVSPDDIWCEASIEPAAITAYPVGAAHSGYGAAYSRYSCKSYAPAHSHYEKYSFKKDGPYHNQENWQ
jgi:hypothetical protein